jgi:hypothetical protein
MTLRSRINAAAPTLLLLQTALWAFLRHLHYYVPCYATYSLSNVAQTENGGNHSMEQCFKPRSTKPLEQKMAKKPVHKEAGNKPLRGHAKRARTYRLLPREG